MDNLLSASEIREAPDSKDMANSSNNYTNINIECLDLVPIAMIVQKNMEIIYVNDEFCKLLHCNKDIILGRSVSELLQLNVKSNSINRMKELDEVSNGEYKINDFQGNEIYIEIKSNSRLLEDSHYEFITFSDVSTDKKKYNDTREKAERKQLKEELLESKELYKRLVDILPDGISIHDGITYSFVSNSYARMLGYDNPKELVGKRVNEVVSKESLELMKQRVETLLSDDKIFPRVEYKFITKQGGTKDVESTSVRFCHNNELNILSSIRDITDKKKFEENRLLLERAMEYDKLKTEFFSNMSHELRTPLNILLSSLQLIEMYTERENNINIKSIRKYTGIMKQNCYRLLRLINNLLDITKIDSGFYQLNMCNHDIVKVVEDITQSVAEYIKGKDIEVVFDTDVEEKIIGCDADKIERVILNLLSNAIKFTKPGGRIEINIHDSLDSINITVRDTGSGIPKDKINNIFDRFIQADKSLSRRSEGTGIGLALVKSLIEMHGGSISVTSNYGEYTQFSIFIPARFLSTDEKSIICNASASNKFDNERIEKMSIEFSDIYM
ncbi:PAS domain S-box protein [Clostridium sp. YIM B02515]|uniref:histidine kinase n=1 Tax=Clostridium rhizosphaerae TaxID=2803861 RepID=A0ABS1TKE4_9CLOT|nr:ATP-binding protein [Clostridium rhizosphaerae]MBL4938438.1 PAS domain S-box protein [Clostridium rhizosphaerae]